MRARAGTDVSATLLVEVIVLALGVVGELGSMVKHVLMEVLVMMLLLELLQALVGFNLLRALYNIVFMFL